MSWISSHNWKTASIVPARSDPVTWYGETPMQRSTYRVEAVGTRIDQSPKAIYMKREPLTDQYSKNCNKKNKKQTTITETKDEGNEQQSTARLSHSLAFARSRGYASSM